MKKKTILSILCCLAVLAVPPAFAKPLIYPVGTIRYDPAKTWNSYIVLSTQRTVKMVDRNGNLVKEWDNKSPDWSMPSKVLPNGCVMTHLYPALPTRQPNYTTIVILDWNGDIKRKFNKLERISNPQAPLEESGGEIWAARQHHDFQIEGMSTGYYAPNQQPDFEGKMLILAHQNVKNLQINTNPLEDDVIVIADKNENILWKWNASEHFDQFDFHEEALEKLRAFTVTGSKQDQGVDWLHLNSASWLGPNKWHDSGDDRFHPENIICSNRTSSHIFIIDHESGDIVWQVTPPFDNEDAALGPLAGIHHAHMIPRGLPGEGNILVFDNGGSSYANLYKSQDHCYSRVIEFDPVAKKKVWEFSGPTQGISETTSDNFFLSQFVSNAQRLPNGNTLICEGTSARIFEVTKPGEIVWEYISPYNSIKNGTTSYIYRAYAVPYEYVPQLPRPEEVAVVPPRKETILIPNIRGELPNYQPKN